MKGTLYIVSTPIGNLEDMTRRAISTLNDVDLILAEDTRVTGKLLKEYDIDKPVMSYHHYSGDDTKLKILGYLIKGKNLAFVTDSGTPGVSDPGNELIDYLLDKEPRINVVPIPGPSALTAALSVSGINVNKFVFIGFMPKKRKNKLISWIEEGDVSFCFFESPKRILKTLDYLSERLGKDREIFVARELTKLHESLYRGDIGEVRKMLESDTLKGELVVVVKSGD